MYLGKVAKFYNKHWVTIVLHCLGGVTMVFCSLLLPIITSLIVDGVLNYKVGDVVDGGLFDWLIRWVNLPYGSYELLGILCGALLILVLIKNILHYTRWNIAHAKMIDSENSMREAIFQKQLEETQSELAKYNTGELMTIANGDTTQIKNFFLVEISWIADTIFTVVVSSYFLFKINWIFSVIALVSGMLMLIAVAKYNKPLHNCAQMVRDRNKELNMFVQENIGGVRVVRAYASEGDEIKKFSFFNKALAGTQIFSANTRMKLWSVNTTIWTCANAIAMGIGGYLCAQGTITLGAFTAFITYMNWIISALSQLPNHVAIIMENEVSAKRIYDFLEAKVEIVEPQNAVVVEGKPHIEVKHLTVKMDGVARLEDICLDIPYGKSIGIMGATGSGKSLLIRALSRFVDADDGEIDINGINIKDIDIESVRGQYSYVIQNVFLFSDSVKANIGFFNPNVSQDDIIKASKIAQADSFVSKLPDGYDTIIGERGTGLSGGQKQRISIARAIIKDAPVMLLDDATSALDTETEKAILVALSSNMNRTIVVTAHRASSVEHCDEIIYLDHGRIAERGSFQEMMALNGKFAEIYRLQNGGDD